MVHLLYRTIVPWVVLKGHFRDFGGTLMHPWPYGEPVRVEPSNPLSPDARHNVIHFDLLRT